MPVLRYYCSGGGTEEILALLAEIKARHNIAYEVLDLASRGKYDEEKEKAIYERDFKPRARFLKKRTGDSITKLRSKKAGHYFVSTPGTIGIVSGDGIEWYTVGNGEIMQFLTTILVRGYAPLDERSK
ncbi:hypothetical protein MYX75_05555 [Acidobacteria bacterium AH-259-A15]|nr:hypothetical protein [Acidobacteria bacterium AH-259-A15]